MVHAVGVFVPIMNCLRIGLLANDLFPNLQISRDVRVTVGLPLDAGKEDQKVWGLSKDASGCRRLEIGSA
jgi:hypothetical protein